MHAQSLLLGLPCLAAALAAAAPSLPDQPNVYTAHDTRSLCSCPPPDDDTTCFCTEEHTVGVNQQPLRPMKSTSKDVPSGPLFVLGDDEPICHIYNCTTPEGEEPFDKCPCDSLCIYAECDEDTGIEPVCKCYDAGIATTSPMDFHETVINDPLILDYDDPICDVYNCTTGDDGKKFKKCPCSEPCAYIECVDGSTDCTCGTSLNSLFDDNSLLMDELDCPCEDPSCTKEC